MENLRAILFADIAGSTGLYEQSGDTVAMAAVVSCIDALRAATLAQDGRVVKTIGDEVMAVFDTAAQAILAANDMHIRFADAAGDGAGIKLRVGLHFGPVIEAEGDFYGDTVNLAARLTGLAAPDQILTSRETLDSLPDYLKATCRRLYATSVKGRKGSVTIIEALWKQDQGETMVSENPATDADPWREARVSYLEQELTVNEARPELSIGRDRTCGLVAGVATASRRHASVVLRKGKILIEDHSSNGTFVTLQNGEELLLRREELVLAGRVLVGLGASLEATGAEPVVIIVES